MLQAQNFGYRKKPSEEAGQRSVYVLIEAEKHFEGIDGKYLAPEGREKLDVYAKELTEIVDEAFGNADAHIKLSYPALIQMIKEEKVNLEDPKFAKLNVKLAEFETVFKPFFKAAYRRFSKIKVIQ